MIYQLGPWQFNTELNLLYCEDSEKELNPLIIKLLTYFIKHPKAIISRQRLIDDVWQQSFVDDNAINRAMSELRKHLQHPSLDEPLIKTHYRLGYSLVLDAKTIEINPTTPVLPSQKKASAKKRLLILCSSVVLLALILSVYWYTQPQETKIPSPDFQLSVIDNQDTHEIQPLFSDNKKYLASSRAYPKLGVKKVHVRRLSDNKQISLTHPKLKVIYALSWQNQKDSLVIRAHDNVSKKCEYLLADISDFDAPPKYSTIKPCIASKDRYAVLDEEGRFFYYNSENNQHKKHSLLRFDLKTKKTSTLHSARPDTNGTHLPRLSPDGKRLSYLSWDKDLFMSVYLKDLTTLDTKLIYKSKHSAFNYAVDWVDNDTIRFIDVDQILTFDANNFKLTQSYQLPQFVKPHYITHKSPTDIYFTNRNFHHYEIKQIDSFDKPEKAFTLFESKQNSHSIQYDNVYQHYYFVSSRSGNEQIWMGNMDGLKQLTNFKDSDTTIRFMTLSPDSKKILYTHNEKQVEIFNIHTNEIREVDLITVKNIKRVAWGADSNSLVYIDKRDKHEVKHYDLATQQHKVLATLNLIELFINKKGVPIALTDKGLVNLTTNEVYPIPSNVTVNQHFGLILVDEYFYAHTRSLKLYRWKKNHQKAEVIDIGFEPSQIEVTERHELIFTALTRRNAEIERLSWQPLENSN